MIIENAKEIIYKSNTNITFTTIPFTISYIIEPTKHELEVFKFSIDILDKYIIGKNEKIINKGFNIVFTDNTAIRCKETNKNVGGYICKIIIYQVNTWRNLKNITDELLIAIFLEELCHMIFNIDDEVEVKYKVYDVMKYSHSQYTLQQYANTIGWKGKLL